MVFKNKYGEIRSGWAFLLLLAVYLGLMLGMGLIIAIAAAVTVFFGGGSADPNALMQSVVNLANTSWMTYTVYILLIGAILLLFRTIYKRPLLQLGLHTDGFLPQLLTGGLLGILAICITVAVLVLSGTARITSINLSGFANLYFWNGFIKFILVGFSEELLSRGFMMTALKTTRNKWVIVLVPAVIFGLLHAANDHVTVFSMINVALVGLLFACLFIKTGRLWAPIGFHITWNFFQGNVFGIAVSGTTNFSIIETVFIGPDWVTGGAFGAEGGIVCTLVILLGLIYTQFFMREPERVYWSMDSDMPLTRGMAVSKAYMPRAFQADEDDRYYE